MILNKKPLKAGMINKLGLISPGVDYLASRRRVMSLLVDGQILEKDMDLELRVIRTENLTSHLKHDQFLYRFLRANCSTMISTVD